MRRVFNIVISIILLLVGATPLSAQQAELPPLPVKPAKQFGANLTLSEKPVPPGELKVSLITCYPGPDVYALCGHTAIRVRSAEMDSVWNYGLFDFSSPNFIYRFVKGETDYSLGATSINLFLPEYAERGSKVVEQELNLSQAEAQKLLSLLRREALPDRRTYRYNYVRDNCATRPVARISEALGGNVSFPDTAAYGSFRNEMRAFHANYPWYQFGIDLVLGSGLDRPSTGKEEMFVPIELMRRADDAVIADGRKLVGATNVLVEGTGQEAILPPTPWWLTPLFWACVVMLIAAVTVWHDLRKGSCLHLVYSLYWLLSGAGGVIVWFLVFFSSHEATSPNLLMWWLNPLMLIAAVTVWSRRVALLTDVLAWIQGVSTTVILFTWPFQPQSTAPAVFPLMLAAMMLCAAYAINYAKGCYKIDRPAARKRSSAARAPRRKAGGARTAKRPAKRK